MAKFKGGTSISHKGYLKITAGPHRYKYVHIMIAEAMLGRELQRDEDVDHRDGNKMNCDWRNLVVRGKSEHGAVSNRQKWFLKNREAHERKEWEEWIHSGGIRPDMMALGLDSGPESEVTKDTIAAICDETDNQNRDNINVNERRSSNGNDDGDGSDRRSVDKTSFS